MTQYSPSSYLETDVLQNGSTKFYLEERLNFFDQEVTNWAHMSKKVYIRIHMNEKSLIIGSPKKAIGTY